MRCGYGECCDQRWKNTVNAARGLRSGGNGGRVWEKREMGMIILIAGVVLWWAAHLFKRVAPGRRAAMGDAAKGGVALAVVASVVLMVVGYRAADYVPLWQLPPFVVHINNLLMIFAFYLYAASGMKTFVATKIRHPQLTAVKIWAVAHLLVNGDVASVVLFGGILAWAVVSVIVINRALPNWIPPKQAPASREVMAIVGTVVVVGVVMGIHNWLGVQPWG
jgi:uncharacterized membrane protein